MFEPTVTLREFVDCTRNFAFWIEQISVNIDLNFVVFKFQINRD